MTNMSWLPNSATACAKNSDCVQVTYACCCNAESGAINAAQRSAYEQLVTQKPRCDVCPAMVCPQGDKTIQVPRCISGSCWLTQ